MSNEAMTINDFIRVNAPAPNARERMAREDAFARAARIRKENHGKVYRYIWPAQYVRRTPESAGVPYFQRLNVGVARFAMSGLGVHKIAAAIGVSHRTVRRVLRPGRDLVTIRYIGKVA